ncbi:MAG: tetratricopeptide repeat protein [Chloroflexi bacterium]|nr:tetratricopeptide repeat protein [Chloroflexota bacterium]
MKWLSWSWSFGRIRGVDIRFHFSMLFSIPIAYYLFHPKNTRETIAALLWVTGFLLCILLHELGHMLAAQLVGVEVKNIVIWILGGLTNLSRKAEKPFHHLIISAAGPLVNIFLAFLCVLFYVFISFLLLPNFQNEGLFLWAQTFVNLFFSLALVNIILVVFNILPIYPLDGGNILHAFMEMLFGKSNADLITLVISIPILLGLIIFGLVTRDYLLLFSCVLIGLAISTLNRSSLHWINMGANYLFKRAGYHYLQGDFERAIQSYSHDIDREPQQANHYLARAACYLNLMQKEKALADVERALKLTPKSAVALQLRGELYSLDKDYDSALEFFTRAQEINPNWAVPYFDRGSVLMDQKEFPAALSEFDKAVSLLGQFPLFYVIRSIANFRLGNFDAAHKDQDLAVNLSEKEALTMVEVNLQVYEGCLDWAEDYYARILLKQPNSWFAFQGRADAYRINNEHEKAIADYTRAIQINPREARLYLGRGKSYLALNEIEKAGKDFQTILTVTDKLHLKRQAEELLKTSSASHLT